MSTNPITGRPFFSTKFTNLSVIPNCDFSEDGSLEIYGNLYTNIINKYNNTSPGVYLENVLFSSGLINVPSNVNITGSINVINTSNLFGSVYIYNTEDSTNYTNGGSLTIFGGASIAKTLRSNIILSNFITSSNVVSTNLTTVNLNVSIGRFTFVSSTSLFSNFGTINNLFTTNITTTTLISTTGSITNLSSTNISNGNIFSNNGSISNLSSINITTTNLLSTNLFSNNGSVSNFVSANANLNASTISNLRINSTQLSSSVSVGSLILEGGLSIRSTQTGTSSSSGNSMTIAGGVGVIKDVYIGDSLYVKNINLTPSLGDIFKEKTFIINNNVVSPTDITDFNFNNALTRYFTSFVSIYVSTSTGDLYSGYELKGIRSAIKGWVMNTSFIGDQIPIKFTITSGGQIRYTNGNITNWISGSIQFRALTTSV